MGSQYWSGNELTMLPKTDSGLQLASVLLVSRHLRQREPLLVRVSIQGHVPPRAELGVSANAASSTDTEGRRPTDTYA